jgi:hypothetical protein
MQPRKHAAPALGDSFLTFVVAVPPTGLGGIWETEGATLATVGPTWPVLPPPWLKARLFPAGRLRAARAIIAILTVRYMRVSLCAPCSFVATGDKMVQIG